MVRAALCDTHQRPLTTNHILFGALFSTGLSRAFPSFNHAYAHSRIIPSIQNASSPPIFH
jgi:hypothetical protein